MAGATKKTIGKDDLRRLMKEQRGGSAAKSKRIESPLAKYNSLGQVTCIVCNTPLKNERLWNAHVQGRSHKENIAALKAGKDQKEELLSKSTAIKNANKRKIHTEEVSSGKKPKSILKNVQQTPKISAADLKNKSLPDDFFQDPKVKIKEANARLQQDQNKNHNAPQQTSSEAAKLAADLPSDFFDGDAGSEGQSSGGQSTVNQSSSLAELIPEGFFDDPKADAKARHVEYKNKMDEEWELFQKSMKEENTVSEAILEEDDEKNISERNIDEIDDQIHRWSKVDKLQKKKELIVKDVDSKEKLKDQDDSGSDVDAEEFEEFLDWRSKKAWT